MRKIIQKERRSLMGISATLRCTRKKTLQSWLDNYDKFLESGKFLVFSRDQISTELSKRK